MTNIILNKLKKSSLVFKLYKQKHTKLDPLNFNEYTKVSKSEDICFNSFMMDYIKNYSNYEIIYVDLATDSNINIRNNEIFLINLPDIIKNGCITCNIYNFIKIKKNKLYILVKNQKNPKENGIYTYIFAKNDILKKLQQISIKQCSKQQLIYVINGVVNAGSLYKYENNKYSLIKNYNKLNCNIYD